MTAGRGIIHSEMPQQEQGRMRGFQLWINLPAREKMKPAGYRDIQPEEIPVVALSGGGRVKVIAGTLDADAVATRDRSAASRRIRCTSTSSFPPARGSRTRFPRAITRSVRVRGKRHCRARRTPRGPRRAQSRHLLDGDAVEVAGGRRAAVSSCSPAARCASPSFSTDRS
jgi:redox-sensitive bicupin YhaK (pirin superfamily)